MSGILEFFNGITPRLQSAYPGIGTHLGERWPDANEAAPRVVFCPKSEDIAPFPGTGGAFEGISNPSPLFSRHCTMEVRIWHVADSGAGEVSPETSIQKVEQVLEVVVQQVHKYCTKGSYALGGGRWVFDDGALDIYGAVYVLDLVLFIPIPRTTDVTAAMTHLPATTQIQSPDGTYENGPLINQ